MSEFFGRKVEDVELYNRKIVFPRDLDLYKRNLTQIIREKYQARKYLYERTVEEVLSTRTSDDASSQLQVIDIESEVSRETEVPAKEITGEWIETKEQEVYDFIAKYPDQKAELFTDVADQLSAARDLWIAFCKGETGIDLLAEPGAGKTIVLGSFIKNFIEHGYIKKMGCISPWPILYVTAATVVEQTRNSLKHLFNIDVVNTVHVVNVELLRTSLGRLFVREQVIVKDGEEVVLFKWNPAMHPCLFVWDERQKLARQESTQTKIACAANRIADDYKVKVVQIGASATPYSRLCEMRHFAGATRRTFSFGLQDNIPITEDNFNVFCQSLLNGMTDDEGTAVKPEHFYPPAIKKAMEFFAPNIVRIGGINPKFKAVNSISKIKFWTKEEADEVNTALEEYAKKKAKIEGSELMSEGHKSIALLAQFTILRRACEHAKRFHFAKFMDDGWKAGKAPGLGLGFKQTITSVVRILIEHYDWSRDDISLIWGGSVETLSNNAKLSKKVKEVGLMDKLREAGITIDLDVLGIDTEQDFKEKTAEQLEFERTHRLLTQKPEERERERIRFQRQDSRGMIFTFKAGGTGLNAQHEPSYPKALPRIGLFSLVYSEKELLQGLGRFPRITSCSNTYQKICGYVNTIEMHVLDRVRMKLMCMAEVVKGGSKESWEDIIMGKYLSNDIYGGFGMDSGETDSDNERLGDSASDMHIFGGEEEEE
jgi:hypothetical protein